jgi:ferredoxin
MTPHPIIKLQPASSKTAHLADLLTWPLLGSFLRWPHSRRVMQTVLLGLCGFIIFDGLLGPQQAPKNLATVTAWVHYRGLVVLALLVGGNLFCMACPFMLPREVGRWLGRRLGFQRHVPRRLRNKWLAVGLLIAFFFMYELYDLWASPWLTAWLIVAYFLTAFVVDTFFQGAAFCKYVCPLGQFNFLGSLVSPTEIKIRSAETCTTCRTKDCIVGNKSSGQRGCELWLFQEKKAGNMDCTFCLDCVYACPHDNIGLIARLPTQELWTDPRRAGLGHLSRRWDVIGLMSVFVFGAYFNAFGMITPVYALQRTISTWLNTTAEWPSLLVIFGGGLIVLPLTVLFLTGWLSHRLAGQPQKPQADLTGRFAYSLVPMGLGMWLAHYAFHFMTGALTIIPVAQAFLNDSGFPAGEPRWELGLVVPVEWIFPLQMIFLYLGLLGSLVVGFQIGLHYFKNRAVALRAFIPWGLLALFLLAAAIWIMFQPMEMRGTIFVGL